MNDMTLCWLHFGDLHVADAGSASLHHFRSMVDVANDVFATGCDFAVLPGDSANDAADAQFRLVRDAIAPLVLPLLVVPGDHDAVGCDTSAFARVLAPSQHFPRAVRFGRHTVVVLDIVSHGRGGPDFAVSDADLATLDDLFRAANDRDDTIVLLTHAYPADMPNNGAALASLVARHGVAFVDMGHTHYNELANDGRTIWAAVRSIGQVEEGPPGFSLAALDGGAVSWRFRPHGASGPFVLITAPADDRLRTTRTPSTDALRARVWSGTAIASVWAELDGRETFPLGRRTVDGTVGDWSIDPFMPPPHTRLVTVRAYDIEGRTDADVIRIGGGGSPVGRAPADGSDRHRIEPWPERGIPGGQLGPNRNGRSW